MGTVTPGNLAMGPGTLYVGAFGAPEPFDSQVNSTPATSAWTDVGGTLDGLTLTVVNQFKELEVDQLVETPERRFTKREVQLKTKMAEVTFANLVIAMVGGTVVTGSAGTQDSYDPPTSDSSVAPAYSAIIFDGVGGGGFRRRVFIRKCLNTDNIDVTNSKDDQQAYPVTFTSHYVSTSIKTMHIVQAKP